jgi:hypothetical protein
MEDLARQHGGLILRTAKVGTYLFIFKRLGEKVLGFVVKVVLKVEGVGRVGHCLRVEEGFFVAGVCYCKV